MSKTTVIAFTNNKGGSGKTTTCGNVGCAMALLGKKVLLIDGDMQVNLTLSFFDEEKALGFSESGKNIYTAIKNEADLEDYIIPTEYKGLDIIPSSPLMSSIEFDLFSKWQREIILRNCLERDSHIKSKIRRKGILRLYSHRCAPDTRRMGYEHNVCIRLYNHSRRGKPLGTFRTCQYVRFL